MISVVAIGHVVADETTVEQCYKIDEHKERCFKAINASNRRITFPWSVARDWCKNQSDGYSLVTIRDDATQDALLSFIIEYELTSSNVWIGARQKINQNWTWIDGTTEPGKLNFLSRRWRISKS